MWYTMNEGYRPWGALKSALSNRGLGIKEKKCLYEGVIVPTAVYGAEVCECAATQAAHCTDPFKRERVDDFSIV